MHLHAIFPIRSDISMISICALVLFGCLIVSLVFTLFFRLFFALKIFDFTFKEINCLMKQQIREPVCL